MPKTDFPDEYLEGLEKNHRQKTEGASDVAERILMYSGARLNWVGEYINDDSISWKLETLPIENIILTGTSPEWNEIIIKQAECSPNKLRELLKDPEIAKMFENSKFEDVPILIRKDNDELKVLDGMNRTIAAIRDGLTEIRAYVGTRTGQPAPKIEPHVVYDILRAYQQRGGNEEDFVGGLRFLLHSYLNVREILTQRFNENWLPNEKIQSLIQLALEE